MNITGTERSDRLHGGNARDIIDGQGGNDILSGRENDDDIQGGEGDDKIFGQGGADTLEGAEGNDVLRGGNPGQEGRQGGSDMLSGGTGDDRLIGGFGADTLTGGSGADHFIFRDHEDSTFRSNDRITDFEQGNDLLVFRGVLRAGHDLHFVGQQAFSHTAGEVRYDVVAGQSQVTIDTDGDGTPDLGIVFDGEIFFQRNDFSF